MTFDSSDFLIFFPVVFAIWLLVRNAQSTLRNGFLLCASYFFYGSWSLPFLGLLLASTLIDFYLGGAIHRATEPATAKRLVSASVVINLSILGFFKYFNFFIDSAVMMLPKDSFLAPTLEVILPVGISFYTFQSMSYCIDVYRKNIKPARSLLDFALYVAFFPQLVAGPIERAANMLPQFVRGPQMSVDKALDGIDLCIRGYFKKVVIADNVAPLVNFVFADVDSASSLTLWIGCYAFAIQIYADFSAYTDIARGTAKLLGFELMENFRSPYRSLNVGEFWRRWHISLSTWFRDYLYTPLGGFNTSKYRQLQSLFLVMALAGLWHGAAWTYVVWGIYHGLLLVLHYVTVPHIRSFTLKLNKPGKTLFKFCSWLLTFNLVVLSFAMFRAQSYNDMITALTKMLMDPLADLQRTGLAFLPNAGPGEEAFYLVLIIGALLAQFTDFETRFRTVASAGFRGIRGALSLAFIFILYPTVKEQFIYFQF